MGNDTIAGHARQAEDALEHLARASWDVGNVPVSEGLYDTIRDLAASARYLVEITGHLSNWFEARAELGRLRLDGYGESRYPSASVAIGTARIAMAEATEAARALATALDEAQQITAAIADTGNVPPDRGPCRCGHNHDAHDGEQADGRCLGAWDPEADDLVDCDCTRYQPISGHAGSEDQ